MDIVIVVHKYPSSYQKLRALYCDILGPVLQVLAKFHRGVHVGALAKDGILSWGQHLHQCHFGTGEGYDTTQGSIEYITFYFCLDQNIGFAIGWNQQPQSY